MAKKTLTREEKEKLYEKLIATNSALELKGDTIPYTSLNGHMFSYLSKDDVVALRLPKDAIAAFIEKYDAELMKAYGIVQKEYVTVPGSLLQKTKELQTYLDLSYEYVSKMKPKPSKKKK